MRRIRSSRFFVVVFSIFTLAACAQPEPAQTCSARWEWESYTFDVGGWNGVDLLVAIDDSASMAEEQAALATALYPLVNALAFPPPTWKYGPADELRIAVVTSNMGLSSYEPQEGEIAVNDEYWPSQPVPAECQGKGDNGAFQAIAAGAVTLADDAIPCDPSGEQCPPGWTCAWIGDDHTGLCHAGGDTAVLCPAADDDWAESSVFDPNAGIALEAACLALQGTAGCGFEQTLQSAVVALVRSDQVAFMVDSHLLAVIVVSDEDDCSLRDGAALFAEDEIQHPETGERDVACGRHPEHLLEPDYFQDALVDAKGKGPGAVALAAIVGVPYGDQEGADACNGRGGDLGDCLETGPMQPTEEVVDGLARYAPACERGGAVAASPGIRYVELAQRMGDMAYVHSICSADWSPAVEEVADLIASCMGHNCFKLPLAWDPATRTARCELLVEYINPERDACPPELGDLDPIVEKEITGEGEETTHVYCAVPKLPSALECTQQSWDERAAFAEEIGWYYCENTDLEDFQEACLDGADNDGDGLVDCADDECAGLVVCGGNDPGTSRCKYVVKLSNPARAVVGAQPVSVLCRARFEPADQNCREDSAAACGNGEDDDDDGTWDCGAEPGPGGHQADPSCCPIAGDPGGVCDVAPAGAAQLYEEICPRGLFRYEEGYPDACREAASRVGCVLP